MDESDVSWFLLQEFDTEVDFSSKVRCVFIRSLYCSFCVYLLPVMIRFVLLLVSPVFTGTSDKDRLLIIQCESGHICGDLIACARYRIEDEREKVYPSAKGKAHVLFIIHLPCRGEVLRSSFVGFQGGQWVSAHIDDIQTESEDTLTPNQALGATVSDLFYNMGFVSGRETASVSEDDKTKAHAQCVRLHSCIQGAVALVVDTEKGEGWGTDRVKLLLDLIPQTRPSKSLGQYCTYLMFLKYVKESSIL